MSGDKQFWIWAAITAIASFAAQIWMYQINIDVRDKHIAALEAKIAKAQQ